MTYKGHEIYARVWRSMSDLYDLDDNGDLNESLVIQILHDDEHIVWYEVELVDPKTGLTDSGAQFDSIAEAKKGIDNSIKYLRKYDNV